MAFNPALERSFYGPSVPQGVGFSPAVKVSYQFDKRVAGGFEYYGSTGPVFAFYSLYEREQQIFPALDCDLGPNWEPNFGVGIGMTQSIDHLITKMIHGSRFNFLGPKLSQ